ncbi:MAG: phytoene/squalene synthase family protein [Bacteroidota bacterium]
MSSTNLRSQAQGPEGLDLLSDGEFQSHMLAGVSRTFALTIPQLPKPLDFIISNAYLLCRIIDTIEDEIFLNFSRKQHFSEVYQDVLAGKEDPSQFSSKLLPLLGPSTLPSERILVKHTDRVIRILHSFPPFQQRILKRCVEVMSRGMLFFQKSVSKKGLQDLAAHNSYCFHVAGIVGEMLTELFCAHSSPMAERKEELMKLAISFGQGLQMTNILKDLWEDFDRDISWLPQDIFGAQGVALETLEKDNRPPGFDQGLIEMLGLAHAHLDRAMRYTLMIPKQEVGIRKFCLWAQGMAILTLQKINQNRNYVKGEQVKISKNQVRLVLASTHIFVKNDRILNALYGLAKKSLPHTPVGAIPLGTPA